MASGPACTRAAAKRFLSKAPTYGAALAELKAEGKCPEETEHRQVNYLNNVVEADRGKLKLPIRPVRGFKTLKTAYATIKGFEVMRALRKGRASSFDITRDIPGETPGRMASAVMPVTITSRLPANFATEPA